MVPIMKNANEYTEFVISTETIPAKAWAGVNAHLRNDDTDFGV